MLMESIGWFAVTTQYNHIKLLTGTKINDFEILEVRNWSYYALTGELLGNS